MKASKIVILIVSRGYPSQPYPLNGIFEFDQAKALVDAGNKVIMACPDIRSIRRKRKLGWEHLEKDGVEIYAYSIPIGAVPYPIAQFFMRYSFAKLAERIIHEHGKPDIAHAHFRSIAACSGKVCKANGIPFIVTEHSSDMNTDNWTPSLRTKATKAYYNADALITVSVALGEEIRKNCNRDYICIPNVVDVAAFPLKKAGKHASIRFVSVGRLIQSKGFDTLLLAFANVKKEYPEASLSIIGEGPQRGLLVHMAKSLDLQEAVTFRGQLQRQEIAKHFEKSDTFILASRRETFGVAYIEAMASGLPVIATRCGGPEDFVTENDGMVVPVDDVDALAEAMKYMITHPDIYNRTDIAARAKERFSPESVAEELMVVYKSVLDCESAVGGLFRL